MLQPLPGESAGLPHALREAVRSDAGGGYATRLLWQRSQSAAAPRPGQAVLGMALNGAQGDDDEALAGHFALLTGRVGARGAMHDWLVANYYTLDSESEKGIISALAPLDGLHKRIHAANPRKPMPAKRVQRWRQTEVPNAPRTRLAMAA